MKTVGFFSFQNYSKSQLLVWAATQLRLREKKLLVADFNLPSPNLHFLMKELGFSQAFSPGFLDYLLFFQDTSLASNEPGKYVFKVEEGLFFMPAGNCPSLDYATGILDLDLKRIFPLHGPNLGLGLFRFLKEHLEGLVNPDFLLIDLPAGFSPISSTIIGGNIFDLVVIVVEQNDNHESVNFIKGVLDKIGLRTFLVRDSFAQTSEFLKTLTSL